MRERSLALKVLPFSVALFALGFALAVFGVVPIAIRFLLNFSSPDLKPMITLGSYLSFVSGWWWDSEVLSVTAGGCGPARACW